MKTSIFDSKPQEFASEARQICYRISKEKFFQMIYLNETQDDSDGASVTSSINRFDPPGPDDSVSRPITPLSSLTGFPSSSSNSIRDFWRRSSVKKPTNQNKKPGFRIPSRVFHSTSSIQKFSSGIQKIKKSALFSRDRLLQGIVASGQYDEAALAGIGLFDQKQQQKKKTLDVKKKTLDVLARANNVRDFWEKNCNK